MRKFTLLFIFIFLFVHFSFAQAFNDEKISAINFVKRVYTSSPFEGVKKIEGDELNYYAVAITLQNVSKDSLPSVVTQAQRKAQEQAEQGFAEPCIKFEMIERYEKGNQYTYLFFCTTLDGYFTDILRKKNVDGAKIISAPNNRYIIASISLENSKYSSPEMRDKTAFMKAKQMINILVNGSTITSDQIIRTDESDNRTAVAITEIVKENSLGFIQGLELLFSKELSTNKTTYAYFTKF